jgi:hypothetical protein
MNSWLLDPLTVESLTKQTDAVVSFPESGISQKPLEFPLIEYAAVLKSVSERVSELYEPILADKKS